VRALPPRCALLALPRWLPATGAGACAAGVPAFARRIGVASYLCCGRRHDDFVVTVTAGLGIARLAAWAPLGADTAYCAKLDACWRSAHLVSPLAVAPGPGRCGGGSALHMVSLRRYRGAYLGVAAGAHNTPLLPGA
jgi:hypothetical protein